MTANLEEDLPVLFLQYLAKLILVLPWGTTASQKHYCRSSLRSQALLLPKLRGNFLLGSVAQHPSSF